MKQTRPPLYRMQAIDEELRRMTFPNCVQLANRLEVTKKTIQRDIDYMRLGLKAPIDYNKRRKGYYYTGEWWFLPTTCFNDVEIKSLRATTTVLAQYKGAPYYAQIRAALDKVLRHLPDALTDQHFLDVYSFARSSAELPDAACFTKLEEAIRKRMKVRITYEAMRTGVQTKRVVHPYRLHLAEDTWFLIAICELRNRPRSFMLRRIRQLDVLDETYAPDSDSSFDVDQYLEKRMFLFIEGEGNHAVKIRFSARHADLIKERKWHPLQQIVENDDGSIILSMNVDAYDVVVCWIMQFGVDAEVLEPVELRKKIVREANAIAHLHSKNGQIPP